MKTILQIADEIGVSKQAIQKRISREPLRTRVEPYISTVDGTKYIDDAGERLIVSAYSKDNKDASIDNHAIDNQKLSSVEVNYVNQFYSQLERFNTEHIKLLQDNLDILKCQLDVKDKQIEKLTSAVKEQAESINAERKTGFLEQWTDTQNEFLAGNEQKEKKGLLSFLKTKLGNG